MIIRKLIVCVLTIILPASEPVGHKRAVKVQSAPRVSFNEVLADAPGPEGDGGGEWVELRNDCPLTVDLSGWVIGDDEDASDRIVPWKAGGSLNLAPTALALVLDPDCDLSGLDIPAGVLLLRPEDASIGNGLKGEGDALRMHDPSGAMVDSVSWPCGAGDGVSWERVGGGVDAGRWKPCRSPELSTPGRINSWTPWPGDRSVSWAEPADLRLDSGFRYSLTSVVKDEGGEGLGRLLLAACAIDPLGALGEIQYRVINYLAPWDSVGVSWTWRPTVGGDWRLPVRVVDPPAPRNWNDADTLRVQVRHPDLSRVLNEAQPRPLKDCEEWVEFWAPPPSAVAGPERLISWEGWTVTVRSKTSPVTTARSLLIEDVRGRVLLIAAGDSVRSTGLGGVRSIPAQKIIWPGLRLADGGSLIALADPYGTVVDSSVLRPVPGLPRGHSWQRWDHTIPGWMPQAWGVGRSDGDVSPGWVAVVAGSGDETDRFRLEIEHRAGGRVLMSWGCASARLWLEARLYDMSGYCAATLIPKILVPGSSSHEWRPDAAGEKVRPGIYILVVYADDADGGARWTVRRPLGVRP